MYYLALPAKGEYIQARGPFGMNNLSHFHNANYVKLRPSYQPPTGQWGLINAKKTNLFLYPNPQ